MLQNTPGIPPQTARLEPDQHAYLAFVDGLRAVSILAVVGFHVGLAGFPGGFVGVDVFFVISGFLIINQIKSALEANRFSIVGFYARRALRILPPFIVVLLATLAVAPFVLPAPTIYLEYMRQAAISPLMLSNFLFYTRQGYFDLNADEKPFLHTWTLSIEEQFYLLAPILLIALFRLGKGKFGALAVAIAIPLGVASLVGAIAYTVVDGRNPAFYFPQWRAWEFIAGGLIGGALAGAVARMPRALADAMGIAGLGLIVVAVTTLDARTPFPSWRAILPVAGAALIILSGLAHPQSLVARLLSLRWMVGIGLVSYSWYLWHWPILSYLRILRLGEPSLVPDLLGGGVLSFLLACLTYFCIERPIRRWRRTHRATIRPGKVVAAGVAACLAVAALGLASGYAGYRLTDSHVQARYGIEGAGVLDNGCVIVRASDFKENCLEGRFGLLIGDSHAQAYAPGLTRSFEQAGVRLVSLARPGCQPVLFSPQERKKRPHGCISMLPPFERILEKRDRIAFVIFASLWPYELDAKEVSDLVAQFDPRTRVLLMGPGPIFNNSSLDCVALSDRYGASRDRCLRDRAGLEKVYAKRVEVLKAVAAQRANVRYLDPKDAFCDAVTCRPLDGDTVYFRDSSHVLPSGAERVFSAFKPEFSWLTGQ
jgi:peptidoglycan/LPS O-acetylase OafA/YrhL